MPQIRPIRDLKNTTAISNLCHEVGEPIFITKNGYGDMVIMSMETFEKSTFTNNLYNKLAIAEEDLKAGRVSDVDDAISEIRQKYGL
ncbi:MAG: type II toxin-antitoxin system Phd/YefM family antitoxin [Spirochaetaceae bacterium]|nr:type II toxin-antitoxin system Phd/YefM family antitoxin [Spirochaetaceae bacterium]